MYGFVTTPLLIGMNDPADKISGVFLLTSVGI